MQAKNHLSKKPKERLFKGIRENKNAQIREQLLRALLIINQ